MKEKLSGPVATGIIIISCIGILIAGYLYVRDPPRIPPEETRRMMTKAQSQPKPQPATPSANPGFGQRTPVPNVVH
jgi:hypothetical protein